MAISKHYFASTQYIFTSRKIKNYPGDEIPTRSASDSSLLAPSLQEKLTKNPGVSASESQVAWDTEPNPLPWSDLPGIPCSGDLARADRPGISSPLSRIGLDGILSLSAHAVLRANNPRQL